VIYFILNSESNHIKIGYSVNPLKRIKALQTGNSSNLEIITVIEGDIKFERILHFNFKKYNIKNEWFIYSEEIKEFLNFINYLYLVDNKPKKLYLISYFEISNYDINSLFEILKFGLYIKSYYEREILDIYKEYFEVNSNPIDLFESKHIIIYKIFSNNLRYNNILDEIHAYRITNELYEPIFD
jgi:hypothetical protein